MEFSSRSNQEETPNPWEELEELESTREAVSKDAIRLAREAKEAEKAAENAKKVAKEEAKAARKAAEKEKRADAEAQADDPEAEIELPPVHEPELIEGQGEVIFDRDAPLAADAEALTNTVTELEETVVEAYDASDDARQAVAEVFQEQELENRIVPLPEIPDNNKGAFAHSLSRMFNRVRGRAEAHGELLDDLRAEREAIHVMPAETGGSSSSYDFSPLPAPIEALRNIQNEPVVDRSGAISAYENRPAAKKKGAVASIAAGLGLGFSFRNRRVESSRELRKSLHAMDESLQMQTGELRNETADLRAHVEAIQARKSTEQLPPVVRMAEQLSNSSASPNIMPMPQTRPEQYGNSVSAIPYWVTHVERSIREKRQLPELTDYQRDMLRVQYPETYKKLVEYQSKHYNPEKLRTKGSMDVGRIAEQGQVDLLHPGDSTLPKPSADSIVPPQPLSSDPDPGVFDKVPVPSARFVLAVIVSLIIIAAVLGAISAL